MTSTESVYSLFGCWMHAGAVAEIENLVAPKITLLIVMFRQNPENSRLDILLQFRKGFGFACIHRDELILTPACQLLTHSLCVLRAACGVSRSLASRPTPRATMDPRRMRRFCATVALHRMSNCTPTSWILSGMCKQESFFFLLIVFVVVCKHAKR